MTFTWGPVGTPLPHMKPADSRFHNPKSSDSNWDQTSDWTIVGPSLAVLDEKLSDESVIARFDRLNQDFLPESPGVVVVNFDHQISHSYGLFLVKPFLSANQLRNDLLRGTFSRCETGL